MYPCNKVEGKRERKRVGGAQEREKQSKESRSKQKRRNQKKEKKKRKNDKDITLNYFVMFIRHFKQYNSTEILSQKKKSLRFFLHKLQTRYKFCQEDG